MNIYFIAYQTDNMSDTSSAVLEIGEVFSLLEGACLLKTTLTTVEVRDYLRERGNAKKVFVTNVAHGAAWSNVNTNSQTIKDLYSEL